MQDPMPRTVNPDKMRHQLDRGRLSAVDDLAVPPGCVPVPPEPPRGTSPDELVVCKQEQEAAWTANMPPLTVCPPWCDETALHQ